MSKVFRKNIRWVSLLLALFMVLVVVLPAAADDETAYENSGWTPVEFPRPEKDVYVGMTYAAGEDAITFTMRAQNWSGSPAQKPVYSMLVPAGHKVLDSWIGYPGNDRSHGNMNGDWIEWSNLKSLGARGRGATVSFAIDWDGVTPVTTQAKVTWQPSGKYCFKDKKTGAVKGCTGNSWEPQGWFNGDKGIWVFESMSIPLTVKGPLDKYAAAAGQIPETRAPSQGLYSAFPTSISYSVSGDAITFMIQGMNGDIKAYAGCQAKAIVPQGAQVLATWMGNPGENTSAAHFDASGNIAWDIPDVPVGARTTAVGFSIAWDGKTPVTAAGDIPCKVGPSTYMAENGVLHADQPTGPVTVKESALKDASVESGIPAPAQISFDAQNPLLVGLSAKTDAEKGTITFTAKALNNSANEMDGITVRVPIPAGTTVVNEWVGNVGNTGTGSMDANGNMTWSFSGLNYRTSTPIMVVTVSGWDGSSFKTQAQGSFKNPKLGWKDGSGLFHNDYSSKVITIK